MYFMIYIKMDQNHVSVNRKMVFRSIFIYIFTGSL